MNPSSQTLKMALVTGATGAIGTAICEGIIQAGLNVVMVARDKNKGTQISKQIAQKTGIEPQFEICDLGRKQEIEQMAKKWRGPLHVLVNNAAECPRRRSETPEGIEKQFATNVLGYFWMINAFSPKLAESKSSRIVNVASYWAGGLDLSDLEFKKRRYDNDSAYRQSKQADRMLTNRFARLLEGQGTSVNVCHSGDVPSNLSHDLGFGGHETPKQGASTPVFLATDELGGRVTGKYFAHMREETCRFMTNKEQIERLFAICASY